ncbi:MAG TPA: hypothetical protein VMY34_09240 [Acidimicrobiales bacterium]|nr:hypothetical protein [Acidimicrobiales bacterium]
MNDIAGMSAHAAAFDVCMYGTKFAWRTTATSEASHGNFAKDTFKKSPLAVYDCPIPPITGDSAPQATAGTLPSPDDLDPVIAPVLDAANRAAAEASYNATGDGVALISM